MEKAGFELGSSALQSDLYQLGHQDSDFKQ